MYMFKQMLSGFAAAYSAPELPFAAIISLLLFTVALSLYECAVYRLVSRRAFYSFSFNMCLLVLPLFICAIVASLQSSLVITLGTIGALAILRFRTAVKDPVDMLYLLWSVFIGITAGCRLYELCLLTSLMATVLLLAAQFLFVARRPYVLIMKIPANGSAEDALALVGSLCRGMRVKSRNFTADGMHYVIELKTKKPDELAQALTGHGVAQFSLVTYDGDDIL